MTTDLVKVKFTWIDYRPNGWVIAENSRGQSGIVPSAYLKPSPKRMPRVETH